MFDDFVLDVLTLKYLIPSLKEAILLLMLINYTNYYEVYFLFTKKNVHYDQNFSYKIFNKSSNSKKSLSFKI